jgi:hypothetical protein
MLAWQKSNTLISKIAKPLATLAETCQSAENYLLKTHFPLSPLSRSHEGSSSCLRPLALAPCCPPASEQLTATRPASKTVWTVAWSGGPSAGITDRTSLPEMKSSSRCGAISAFPVPVIEADAPIFRLGSLETKAITMRIAQDRRSHRSSLVPHRSLVENAGSSLS